MEIQTIPFEQRWATLENFLKNRFDKTPDLQAILYLIGINEYRGVVPEKGFSKEQKQDLMHVAVCTLLTPLGYYEIDGYDEQGWPVFIKMDQKTAPPTTESQEQLLKECVLHYFDIE